MNDLTIIPANNSLASLAKQINHTYAVAKHHAQMAIVFALRTGALCNLAKEQLPHGDFLPWLEEHCPEITQRTAQKYMALVGKYESSSYLPEAENLLPMLTAPDFSKELEDPEKRDALASHVREVTNERSLTQLYMDFGIIRKPSKPAPVGPRGASLDPKDDTRSPEEKLAFARERDIEDLSKMVQGLELMIKEFAAIRDDGFARALSTRLRELSDEVMRLTKGLES